MTRAHGVVRCVFTFPKSGKWRSPIVVIAEALNSLNAAGGVEKFERGIPSEVTTDRVLGCNALGGEGGEFRGDGDKE